MRYKVYIQRILSTADKWCLGIMEFYPFCGQKTTGSSEGFNKSMKDMFDKSGHSKHCMRLDKLVYLLIDTVLASWALNWQLRVGGAFKTLPIVNDSGSPC